MTSKLTVLLAALLVGCSGGDNPGNHREVIGGQSSPVDIGALVGTETIPIGEAVLSIQVPAACDFGDGDTVFAHVDLSVALRYTNGKQELNLPGWSAADTDPQLSIRAIDGRILEWYSSKAQRDSGGGCK
ncbi:MAG: hypothetical protein ACYTBZ_30450 [Planctomycetota bacterium]|jgi:hypothetical protein